MLYRLHNTIFIIELLLIGFLAVLASDRSFCAMTVGTVVAFVSQLLLLIYFSQDKDVLHTNRVLFLTMLVYYVLVGALFMSISYYYDGDTFMLNKLDAMFYFKEGMKSVDMGLAENVQRIIRRFEPDDWGALLTSSVVLYLIPSKLFMNAIYMFAGAVSVVMLFHMGKHFMPVVYAFEAALAYGTSSFMVFYHCAYLKESLFVFYVIAAMYFFFRAAIERKYLSFFGAVICVAILAFYRPAVSAFLVISFFGYYAITQRGTAFSLFLYVMIAGAMAVSMVFLQDQVDRYAGGDMDSIMIESSSANYSGMVNIVMGWFVGLFGPFPTLFPMPKMGPELTNFYGAGLTYRLFLAIPFWMGVLFTVKRRNFDMVPILSFVLVEMLASAYVLASFELRKVLMHVPFMYILSFYGLYQMEMSKKIVPFKQLIKFGSYAMTIGILIVWNVFRVKG